MSRNLEQFKTNIGRNGYALSARDYRFFSEQLDLLIDINALKESVNYPDQLYQYIQNFEYDDFNKLFNPFRKDDSLFGPNKEKVDRSFETLRGWHSGEKFKETIERLIFLQTVCQFLLPELPQYQHGGDFQHKCDRVKSNLNYFISCLLSYDVLSHSEVYQYKFEAVNRLSQTRFNIADNVLSREQESSYCSQFNKLDLKKKNYKENLSRLNSQYNKVNRQISNLKGDQDDILIKRESFLLKIADLYCKGDSILGLKSHSEYYFKRIFGDYFNYNNGKPTFKEGLDFENFKNILNHIFDRCLKFRNRFFTRRQCGLIANILRDQVNVDQHALGIKITQGDVRAKQDFKYNDRYISLVNAIDTREQKQRERHQEYQTISRKLQSLNQRLDRTLDSFDRDITFNFARRGRIQSVIDEMVMSVLRQFKYQLSSSTIAELKKEFQIQIEHDYPNHTFYVVDKTDKFRIEKLIESRISGIIAKYEDQKKKSELLFKLINAAKTNVVLGGGDDLNLEYIGLLGLKEKDTKLPSTLAKVLNDQIIRTILKDSNISYKQFKTRLTTMIQKNYKEGSILNSRSDATENFYQELINKGIDIEQAVDSYYKAVVNSRKREQERVTTLTAPIIGFTDSTNDLLHGGMTNKIINAFEDYWMLCKKDVGESSAFVAAFKKSPQSRFNQKLKGYAHIEDGGVAVDMTSFTYEKLDQLFDDLTKRRPKHKKVSEIEKIIFNEFRKDEITRDYLEKCGIDLYPTGSSMPFSTYGQQSSTVKGELELVS
ncbi:MAG: hypothetical protein EP298_01460 [Gammaproteobacteria bacterium]|nr:MAG: hypothetical protein EP298_01460 [Gammaproteobacteria bacterium]UTW42017.1 hypothetical protein KFE69_10970 [bacterium SCSIO 12844]